MNKNEIWSLVDAELKRARKEAFPVHVVAQASQVSIACGKLLNAANKKKYNDADGIDAIIKKEAVNTIVQALIFLENN